MTDVARRYMEALAVAEQAHITRFTVDLVELDNDAAEVHVSARIERPLKNIAMSFTVE